MKQILCIHLPRFQIDLHKRQHRKQFQTAPSRDSNFNLRVAGPHAGRLITDDTHNPPARQLNSDPQSTPRLAGGPARRVITGDAHGPHAGWLHSDGTHAAPLVLVQSTAHRQLIVAVSADAPRTIRRGMTLAQARAHCSTLLAAEAPSEEQNNRALTALGRWLIRFSPNVSLAPPSSIFLDASGLERLFPDPQRWLDNIKQSLRRLRFDAQLILAPTPAAAWAVAVFSDCLPLPVPRPSALRLRLDEERAGVRVISQTNDHRHSKSPSPHSSPGLPGEGATTSQDWSFLPPEALRLTADRCLTLHSLGLTTIGQLQRIPHNELKRRFPDVLLRLRQLTGELPEPLNWLSVQFPIREKIEFETTVESLEAIEMVIRQLLEPIVQTLTHRGQGVRRLTLTLRRPYAASIEKTIELIRPSRRTAILLNLLMRSLECLEAEAADLDGFIGFEIEATMTERLDHEQTALNDEAENQLDENRDHLIERLRARFGEVVQWLQPVESHLPERAFSRVRDETDSFVATLPALIPRPLRLLPTPRRVNVMLRPRSDHGRPISFTDGEQVHRLEHVHGPERIASVWWNSSKSSGKTRDYFDVQSIEGNRFWLFQVLETNTWYLHGLFD